MSLTAPCKPRLFDVPSHTWVCIFIETHSLMSSYIIVHITVGAPLASPLNAALDVRPSEENIFFFLRFSKNQYTYSRYIYGNLCRGRQYSEALHAGDGTLTDAAPPWIRTPDAFLWTDIGFDFLDIVSNPRPKSYTGMTSLYTYERLTWHWTWCMKSDWLRVVYSVMFKAEMR